MPLRNPFRRDLILLHAPSVYDYRRLLLFYGPFADAVPSTHSFEMYPVGLTSIAAFLEANHYNVQIVNLAYRMARDPEFAVEPYLARLHADVFGIDLHWLPHVQGALAIAEVIKRLHPRSKVLLGGFSASYFHRELLAYPQVDFVLRGDSTEEPARQLLQALRTGGELEGVENLSWRRADGSVAVNRLTFVPDRLDYVDAPAYRYALSAVFKYHCLENMIPYLSWLRYPTTLLLNARGCTQNCSICGGSASAYRRVCGRSRPAFRSPEKLIDDLRTIGSFSLAPIFMVHDPRLGGMERARRFFELCGRLRPQNELVFELFAPADAAFFRLVAENVPRWSVELTLEAPQERLRRANGKLACSDAAIEETICNALEHGCDKFDLFFMVGIPHQSYADALETVSWCDALLARFPGETRIRPFIAPLGPFLDPGSRAFEEPAFGYTVHYRTVEDYRRALLRPNWDQVLSYRTETMDRDEIVRATYAAARGLNAVKFRYGIVDTAEHVTTVSRIERAERVYALLRDLAALPAAEAEERLHGLRDELRQSRQPILFSKEELSWPLRHRFRLGGRLLQALAAALAGEVGHCAARLIGRFDSAPYRGDRLEPLDLPEQGEVKVI